MNVLKTFIQIFLDFLQKCGCRRVFNKIMNMKNGSHNPSSKEDPTLSGLGKHLDGHCTHCSVCLVSWTALKMLMSQIQRLTTARREETRASGRAAGCSSWSPGCWSWSPSPSPSASSSRLVPSSLILTPVFTCLLLYRVYWVSAFAEHNLTTWLLFCVSKSFF